MLNRRTVLYDVQREFGGKFVDFHGWDMPVQFSSIGAEHHAVRQASGLFDLGHMGRLRLSGDGALAFLEERISRPLASMVPGQVRYGLVCAADGTVEDDVLVSRESEQSFHIVVNASNAAKICQLWQQPGDDVSLQDLTEEQAMLAVQGPQAAELLAGLGLTSDGLCNYRFHEGDWQGVPVRLSRTGYTGEDGFECFLPADRAAGLWRAVQAAGAQPCGLGARDTLRLEAGMPLYGQELDRAHTPIEAGLGFAVAKEKSFIGSDVLQRQRAEGTRVRLVGLRIDGRRPARQGYPVLAGEAEVGTVTSGTRSPTLGQDIAMAYVASAQAAIGTALTVDVRGRSREPAEVVPLPFYRRA